MISKADSGGPLTYKSGDQHILIGDVSFGGHWGCGKEGKYSAFGRISHFRKWIEKEMKKLDSPKYCSSGPDADAAVPTPQTEPKEPKEPKES